MIVLLCVLLPMLATAAGNPGTAPLSSKVSFNEAWKFARFGPMPDGGNSPEPAELQSPSIDDAWWATVNLPHDWAISGPFRMDLPGETGKLPWAGIGWYRKNLFVPAADKGLLVCLDIDGAMSHPQVYVNGQLAGEWAYGYSSFRVDITRFVKFGANNLIAIRLDNPPSSSRWYPGGGIYRNLWLVKLPQAHLSQWGVQIRTPAVSEAYASLEIDTELENSSSSSARLSVRHEIFSVGGRERAVASVETPVSSVAAGEHSLASARLQLNRPELWSVEDPNLYTVRTTLLQDGTKVLDVQNSPLGLRTAVFTADGFFLNGRKVPLQGVCEHHDLGPLGAAFNTSAMERKLRILKEMGANALRTSHNPVAPEVLDLCDRMGILVLEEAFDCWKKAKTPNDYARDFPAWHERDIAAMVRRDRNHPSIILWSIGNEIPEQGMAGGVELASELTALVKSHDRTRQVTMGLNYPNSVKNGFYKGADVIGINYKPHLYAENRSLAPGVPLFSTETSSTVSSRGVYFFPVSNDRTAGFAKCQVSSYDLYYPYWAQTPDQEWAGQDKNRFVAGEFVWTGFDYLGEPTPYNDDHSLLNNVTDPAEKARMQEEIAKYAGKLPSRSSYFGIIDLAGLPKDRYYLYQSRWRPDFPMAHILPHWTWPDRVGQVTPVFVYSNGDEAELFLNGQSLGKRVRRPGEYRFRWDDVVYQPGELSVTVTRNGRRWAKDSVRTAGAASGLRLEADSKTITADGKDLVFVTADIIDDQQVSVPSADSRINFFVDGPGKVIAVCNGDATSFAPFNATSINAFSGKAVAIICADKGAEGRLRILARGNRLPEQSIEVRINR